MVALQEDPDFMTEVLSLPIQDTKIVIGVATMLSGRPSQTTEGVQGVLTQATTTGHLYLTIEGVQEILTPMTIIYGGPPTGKTQMTITGIAKICH